MNVTIWYAIKPGEPRRFIYQTVPTEAWQADLRKEGYKLFSLDFYIRDTDLGVSTEGYAESRDGGPPGLPPVAKLVDFPGEFGDGGHTYEHEQPGT